MKSKNIIHAIAGEDLRYGDAVVMKSDGKVYLTRKEDIFNEEEQTNTTIQKTFKEKA